jgi:preprotein translocase subunit Sec63
MGTSQQMDKKTIFRSIVFVIVLWAVVALLFFGLFKLFEAIDIGSLLRAG